MDNFNQTTLNNNKYVYQIVYVNLRGKEDPSHRTTQKRKETEGNFRN